MFKVGDSVDIKTRRVILDDGSYTPVIGIVVGIEKRWILPTRYLIRWFPVAGIVIQRHYREDWFYKRELIKLYE